MKTIKKAILPGAEIIETALWLKKPDVLIIADLHLGFEETQTRQGVMLPRFNFEEIKKSLEKIFAKRERFEKIVIDGDLKHEFGIPSQQEWKEALGLLDLLQKHCKEILLVQGNHDNVLGPIAAWRGIRILKEGFFLEKEKIFITHGHKFFFSREFEQAKTIIIGHDHVAVTIREGTKRETFKCFLKGKYEGKCLVVLPSMSPIATGTDVLKNKLLSPFLQGDMLGFECWVVADKQLYFGKLKNIERLG